MVVLDERNVLLFKKHKQLKLKDIFFDLNPERSILTFGGIRHGYNVSFNCFSLYFIGLETMEYLT